MLALKRPHIPSDHPRLFLALETDSFTRPSETNLLSHALSKPGLFALAACARSSCHCGGERKGCGFCVQTYLTDLKSCLLPLHNIKGNGIQNRKPAKLVEPVQKVMGFTGAVSRRVTGPGSSLGSVGEVGHARKSSVLKSNHGSGDIRSSYGATQEEKNLAQFSEHRHPIDDVQLQILVQV